MISLINTHFGEGYADAYFSNEILKEGYQYLSNENNSAVLIFSPLEYNPKLFGYSENAMVLNVIVVDQSQQNRGAASELLNEFFEMYALQFDIIIPLWNYKGSENLKRWIVKKGGELVETFNEYWREESLEKNYVCLQCGTPPCWCGMDLYVIKAE